MIQFEVVTKAGTVKLNLMGREKIYTNGELVTEDAYTKAYPMHFKRIGEIKGYGSFLSTPVFIPDRIDDFVNKEKKRKIEVKPKENSKKKEVEIDEIAIAAEEFLEGTQIINESEDNSLQDFDDSENFDEDDVKIEIEE
jgi:hypothetical protein